MATIDIETKLNYEIEWRTGEISIVKTIPFLYSFSSQQSAVLKKHTIPIIYSLWEGFVVESFNIYTREINALKLSKDQICINILVHALDQKCALKQGRPDFEEQIKLIQDLTTYLDSEIDLSVKIPTESNVNRRVINNILRRYNLAQLPEKPYQKWLDRLLFFRNKLSHGESSLPIDQPLIDEMSMIVISCMHIVTEKIVEGYRSQSYLRV